MSTSGITATGAKTHLGLLFFTVACKFSSLCTQILSKGVQLWCRRPRSDELMIWAAVRRRETKLISAPYLGAVLTRAAGRCWEPMDNPEKALP